MNKTMTAGQKAFQKIFNSNFWGSRSNSGKQYKRPYSKTNSSAKEYADGLNMGPPETKSIFV